MLRRLLEALAWGGLALVLAGPIVGVQLVQDGPQLALAGEWGSVLWLGLAIVLLRLAQAPAAALAARLPAAGPARSLRTLVSHPVIVGVLMLALVVWPFFGSRHAVDVATLALIYVMLGLGLNVVVGLAGLLDLGYVAFYAVGAYSYALLNLHFDLSFWQSLPVAAGLAATFGFLLGFPVLRLRGDYLAIVTLGFGEIIRLVLNNWDELTGGPNGIGGIPKPELFGLEFSRRASEGGSTFHEFFGLVYDSSHKIVFMYLLALLFATCSYLIIRRLIRMPIGRAWEALREDEIACRALGLNPTAIKLSAFTLGASFAGFAGCFYAARQTLVSPESFGFIESAIILAIVILGGMGSQLGVIVAAVAMTVIPELAREFDEYRMLLFGLAMVVMMIWRPQGLLPSRRRHIELPAEAEQAGR